MSSGAIGWYKYAAVFHIEECPKFGDETHHASDRNIIFRIDCIVPKPSTLVVVCSHRMPLLFGKTRSQT
jgi:hypothetical protein